MSSRFMKSSTVQFGGTRRGVVVYDELDIDGNSVIVKGRYVRACGAMTLLNLNYYSEGGSIDVLTKYGLKSEYIEYAQVSGGYVHNLSDVFYKLDDVLSLLRSRKRVYK